MTRRLRLAIVGAGSMGRVHAAQIAANGRCELAATVDPAAEGADFRSIAALLESGQALDGAIVATPNHLHVETASALLEAGIPVLVEKPVAESNEAAEKLTGTVRATGVAALVGQHRRHSTAIAAARESIEAGRLGRIVAVNATTLFHKPAAYFATPWRRQPEYGGPILINLIHDIDSLRWLAGEVMAVQAMASSRTRGLAVEDTAAVLLEFSSGALGTLLVSDATVAPHSWEQTSGENPIYARDASQDCLTIAGTLGTLVIPSLRLWRQDAARASWTEPFCQEALPHREADPLARQLDHFCDVIEHGAAPVSPVADAARSLEVALAVRQAAYSGGRIELRP